MIELLTDNIYAIAGVAIAAIGIARFYYGPRFNEVPWQPLRRVFIPLAHTIAKRSLGEEFYATYNVSPVEHVATLETKPGRNRGSRGCWIRRRTTRWTQDGLERDHRGRLVRPASRIEAVPRRSGVASSTASPRNAVHRS